MTNIQASSGVTCGTVMVQEGPLLPKRMEIVTERYSSGWRTVSGADGFAFDRKLRLLGWKCLFLAGELKAISFASSKAGRLNAAVLRLLAKVRSQDFNCVEFTNIIRSRFLGIPYVSVYGHACHIQQDCQLESVGDRSRQQKEADQVRN